MKRTVLALAAVALLALPASALAKLVAVELTSGPAGVGPGEAWTPQLRLAAQPENPPTLTIRNVKTGEEIAFRATPAGPGTFDVRVVFPVEGDYSYEVFDAVTGLSYPLGAASILDGVLDPPMVAQPIPDPASDSGSFPVWPVVVGALAVLGLTLAAVVLRPRRERLAWGPDISGPYNARRRAAFAAQ